MTERKLRILEAVIADYTQTAEPVGSRTIAKKFDLGISSATIRNEMSDLEEMGLLSQPHASSGRVPSDKGYRLFVDKIMEDGLMDVLSNEEAGLLRTIIRENVGHLDFLMKETAKVVSRLTNLAAVVVAPPAVKQVSRFKRLHLVELDDEGLILITATEERDVRHFIIGIPIECPVPTRSDLVRMTDALNGALAGAYNRYSFIGDYSGNGHRLEDLFGDFAPVLPELLKKAFSVLADTGVVVYTSGIKNLLSFPEFSDAGAAAALFQCLEERNTILEILGGNNDTNGISASIGGENAMTDMRHCSVVKGQYRIGDGFGSIGVLGPTRMDYPQVMSVLNAIISNIRIALSE